MDITVKEIPGRWEWRVMFDSMVLLVLDVDACIQNFIT